MSAHSVDPQAPDNSPGRGNTFLAGGRLPRTRAALRRWPRLQGAILAPAGLHQRLPERVDGYWFPFYHDVPDAHRARLRLHLKALLSRGRFVTWDEAVDGLERSAPVRGPQFCLSFDDGHETWMTNVLPLLEELGIPATFFVTTSHVVAGESRGSLTWTDVARLVDHGMTIGAHSVTHARLSLLDDARSRREVVECKQELEQRIGAPVEHFAAPFGLPGLDYGTREVRYAREAGFRSVASARPGHMLPGESVWQIDRAGLSPAWPLPAVRHRLHP